MGRKEDHVSVPSDLQGAAIYIARPTEKYAFQGTGGNRRDDVHQYQTPDLGARGYVRGLLRRGVVRDYISKNMGKIWSSCAQGRIVLQSHQNR